MGKQNQRPVLRLDQGIVVEEYESISIAAKTVKRTHANIRQAILKNYKCAGFNWLTGLDLIIELKICDGLLTQSKKLIKGDNLLSSGKYHC